MCFITRLWLGWHESRVTNRVKQGNAMQTQLRGVWHLRPGQLPSRTSAPACCLSSHQLVRKYGHVQLGLCATASIHDREMHEALQLWDHFRKVLHVGAVTASGQKAICRVKVWLSLWLSAYIYIYIRLLSAEIAFNYLVRWRVQMCSKFSCCVTLFSLLHLVALNIKGAIATFIFGLINQLYIHHQLYVHHLILEEYNLNKLA
jgi:hypothetical protein